MSNETRETKVLIYTLPTDLLPGSPDSNGIDTGVVSINIYAQNMLDAIGEGWRPVSHQFFGGPDGRPLISILIERELEVPENASAIS